MWRRAEVHIVEMLSGGLCFRGKLPTRYYSWFDSVLTNIINRNRQGGDEVLRTTIDKLKSEGVNPQKPVSKALSFRGL